MKVVSHDDKCIHGYAVWFYQSAFLMLCFASNRLEVASLNLLVSLRAILHTTPTKATRAADPLRLSADKAGLPCALAPLQ
jgi:hypothetical protein